MAITRQCPLQIPLVPCHDLVHVATCNQNYRGPGPCWPEIYARCWQVYTYVNPIGICIESTTKRQPRCCLPPMRPTETLPRINCVFEDLALQFPTRVTLLQLLFSFIRDPSRPLFLVPSLFVISCVHSPMVMPREFASPGSRRFLIGCETLWYDGSRSVETSSFNDR